MRLLLFVFCVVFSIAVVPASAASELYVLQRRIGVAGKWSAIASVKISRSSPSATARLRHEDELQRAEAAELSKEEKDALAAAQFVFYRLVLKGDDDGARAVVVAITPCSLVRGFEALDSRAILLRESLAVAVGPNTSVIGLQVASETNTFHTKMVNGDECELSVLSLFPQVRTLVSVGLVEPTLPRSFPDYRDFSTLAEKDSKGQAKSSKAKRKKRDGATDSTSQQNDNSQQQEQKFASEEAIDDEDEEEEDNRTFLQKYWLYLLIPFSISFVQNIIAAK